MERERCVCGRGAWGGGVTEGAELYKQHGVFIKVRLLSYVSACPALLFKRGYLKCLVLSYILID